MTHKSGSIFGEAYSAIVEPANQSFNQQRSIGQREGRGVWGGEARTSLTTKSAGGAAQRRGKGIKERDKRTRECAFLTQVNPRLRAHELSEGTCSSKPSLSLTSALSRMTRPSLYR